MSNLKKPKKNFWLFEKKNFFILRIGFFFKKKFFSVRLFCELCEKPGYYKGGAFCSSFG
jgi:hypothetical protein